MNFLKRLMKYALSESNSLVDELESPIQLAEQSIVDLKKNMSNLLEAMSSLKKESNNYRTKWLLAVKKGENLESKAIDVLKMAQKGGISEAEADRLASKALSEKENYDQQGLEFKQLFNQTEESVHSLEVKLKDHQSQIDKYQHEVAILKARLKVSKANSVLNKKLSAMEGSGSLEYLERLKDQTADSEAKAEAYAQLNEDHKPVEKEIEDVLKKADIQDKLNKLKKDHL